MWRSVEEGGECGSARMNVGTDRWRAGGSESWKGSRMDRVWRHTLWELPEGQGWRMIDTWIRFSAKWENRALISGQELTRGRQFGKRMTDGMNSVLHRMFEISVGPLGRGPRQRVGNRGLRWKWRLGVLTGSSSSGEHVEWAEEGTRMERGWQALFPQRCLRGGQETWAKKQLLIPRSGSGEQTPKVGLPSCLMVGWAGKPFRRLACFIIHSNSSSFYYANCILTKQSYICKSFFTPKRHPNAMLYQLQISLQIPFL